ncbi:C40 family peptidase [Streptomyces sp. NBC_01462]|uniref:C40 family peptidase n=1 Tax=Streptomyces sp. NBC_01462 TaxID=2903876 RepID=UPI002E2F300F|nr:bifunctional lytic transglycosylase/C40 family peptidase [Streptomyces sp. NBC_01462]
MTGPASAPRRRLKRWLLAALLPVLAAGCCALPLMSAMNALTAVAAAGSASALGIGDESGSAVDIPPRMLTAYKKAATGIAGQVPRCKGMTWPVLAGIAKVESNHAAGRSISAAGDIRPKIYGVLLNGSGSGGNTTSFPDTDGGKWDGTASGERAVGPFQFLPSTWESTGRDGNRDGVRDPHNADDAALGAAVYLCGHGRKLTDVAQLRSAILQYNHSGTYADTVLGWISRYRSGAPGNLSGSVATVVNAALAERGAPYSWGGGTTRGRSFGICCAPSGKSGVSVFGFDCSGLTLYAFAKGGIRLPHNADAQAAFGRRIPASLGQDALKAGDLVFFADGSGVIYHVGIALGNGTMVNAPRPGTVVRVDPIGAMSGYAGGARLL